jgi:hypothetical protein
MPVNWYAALVLIVLLGIGSVVLARFHYAKAAVTVQPAVGQTWHAALAFDICGTMEPALPATPSGATTGLTSAGSGVLLIAPKSSSEAGHNATLGKFASGYTGMTLTNTSVQYPGTKSTVYKNGATCPTGTPDAGKKGEVRVRSWTLSTATGAGNETKQVGGHYAAKPAALRFANSQLITVAFVPATTSVPKVPASTVLALVQTVSGTAPVTTTTANPSTPTVTVPTTTPTTAAGGTTTTPTTAAGTTTTVPSTTSTTAKPSTTSTTK